MSKKQPFPGCEQALLRYYQLRKRLYNYFFHGVQLKITNSQTIMAYSDVYNLIDRNPQVKLNNQKKYQMYEQTLFTIFKNDLINFCQQVKQKLIQKKGISSSIDELSYYYEWIINYTWFLRWTHKIISSIQKNIAVFSRTSLFYTGLTIMRDQIINPLYTDLFNLIIVNLQLFKEGSLQQYSQLQFMIQVIGQCGFMKYFSVKLEKNQWGFFNFVSINKQTNLIAQVQYQTDYFLRKFINQYVKYLKNKYNKITQEMIKLSTPQYVNKAMQHLQKQQKAADFFYSNPNVKNIIIRSIQQTIIANRCKQLIQNQKTGLVSMIESDNIEALRNLYQLTKRTSMQKIFGQCYQNSIQKYVSQDILGKLTPQQQKAAKKQTVSHIIQALYQYFIKIQKITIQVQQFQKDSNQMILITCQNNGFQIACNKSNTVCNFLAYYCDNILKKQPNASDMNSKQLLVKLGKLLKFMYSLDQFLKVYQRMLGIRILYDAFKNKQIQVEIINMLKKQVGLSSMAKIMTMIQDTKFSENFNVQKSQIFRNKISFNFHVIMLTSGAWQITDTKNNKKLVPAQLMKAVQVCQEQYYKLFPGRQITWLFNYGRAIVQVKFDDQSKALLMLNNYQLLTVLFLQRRNFQSVKIQQIISQINPQEEPALMAALMMLVKKGVLKKQGNPLKIQSKSQIVSFNFTLKLKAPKLGCFEVPRFAQRIPTINNQLNAERIFIVQANIIKLMKMKRVLRYQEIIPQVISMCKTFKADIGMVKNQIQNCIHRQFLQRDAKQFNTLVYKP